MFAPVRKWSFCIAAAVLLPASTLSAQTFAFDFTSSGGFVSNIANNPQNVITHNTITGPLNPFGVTKVVSLQNVVPIDQSTLALSGTFTWFTNNPLNTIVGNYAGNSAFGGATFSFANIPFTITGGTGLYVNLRSIPVNFNTGSGTFLGNPTLPGDVVGTASIRNFGSAQIVPEPSTVLLMCAGLGALAIPAARRRKMRGTIS